MYGWLNRIAEDASQVVTASHRLARVLANDYNARLQAAGRTAWRTPAIHAYGDWIVRLFDSVGPGQRPVRINGQQSRALWDQALRDQIDDPLVNIANLSRQARDAWKRAHEWDVPFDEIVSSASGRDQRIFASAATRYCDRLAAEDWVDDVLLVEHVISTIESNQVSPPPQIFLAGFDRLSPQADRLLESFKAQGVNVEVITADEQAEVQLMAFENEDAELRAAGAWTRSQLDADPEMRVGIVVSNLERNAGRAGRLVREGLAPGWQYAQGSQGSAVNVSFGRRLIEYPAIEIALLVLNWAGREVGSRELSQLLRTPFLGAGGLDGRSRLETALRKLPDRRWSVALALRALGGRDDSVDAGDWLARLSRFLDSCREQPGSASPAYWAEQADALLKAFNWPGEDTLDSADFQLVDRWRDLLNDLAKLELVVPAMSMSAAFSQLTTMAAEVVFQPEAFGSVVQVLGPLEAAGMSFDCLWVSGMTANQWPPGGRPLPLISRRLQKHYGMPDAEPRDTSDYAKRVVMRLRGSATECVFSYAMTADDTEQAPTALITDVPTALPCDDPGWHAIALSDRAATAKMADDPVPPVETGHTVSGGATTIQRQLSEPLSAFVHARLGVQRLETIGPGLNALIRGNLVHEALFQLYAERPSQKDIIAWSHDELEQRIDAACNRAFSQFERHADEMLRRLFALERKRVARLLVDVVTIDRQRQPFRIDDVEARHDFVISGMRLELRIDRVDRYDDETVAILDYKTGALKKFLDSDGDPKDIQLAVYACALEEKVAALGLFNVDSRETVIDECGVSTMDVAAWSESLRRWSDTVAQAARDLAAGDVRVDEYQELSDARPLSLLSRIGELRRDA